jgi:molybdopterin/thiamine biosynthesis adenylyltransferase
MLEHTVMMIGVGGIGSNVALGIGRMGCQCLWLIDPDKVEMHNLGNQFYSLRDVQLSLPKVYALKGHLRRMTLPGLLPVIRCTVGCATRNPFDYQGIVITAPDSLEVRKDVFAGCRMNAGVKLYIEAAAGHRLGVVYALDPRNPEHVRAYERTIARRQRVSGPAPCVDPHMGPVFAAIIGQLLCDFASEHVWRKMLTVEINFMDGPSLSTSILSDEDDEERRQ